MSHHRTFTAVQSDWRGLAAGVALSAVALLSACGQSSAPPANSSSPPIADANKPADNGKQLSVAELTGQPSDATSPPVNPPANPTAPSAPPPQAANAPRPAPGLPPMDERGRPAQTSGALASSAYAPHPARAPIAGATPPPPPVYDEPIDETRFARVVSVTQLTQPQRVCTNETVTERRPSGDRHQVAGTVIGAIAGGVIGHQFGGGRGRDLATVGGAVGGGVVGKEIQRSHQRDDTVTRTVQHCRTVTPGRDVVALYDVVYAYQNQNFHVKLDHDPGDRIPLPVRGIDVTDNSR